MKARTLATSIALVALFLTLSAASDTVSGGAPEERTLGSDTTGTWAEFRGNLNNTGYSTSSVPAASRVFLRIDTGWGFRSSPVVHDGILYFGSDGAKVHAVNISTGEPSWNFTAGSDVWATPLVVGDTVYVGSADANFYALNARNGTLRWTFPAGDSIAGSAKYADGTVVFASYDRNVYILNATTGLPVSPPFVTEGEIWSTPAIVDGTAIIGGNDGNLSRFYLGNRTVMWNFTLSPDPTFVKYSSAAVDRGRVFVGSSDRNAYAIDLATGAEVWRFTTGGYVYASPGVHGDRVFVHSADGNLYGLPFDDPNGDGLINASEVLWEFPTGDGAGIGEGGSSPAIADGKVLVGSRPGRIYCLDEITGEEVWRFETQGDPLPSFSSPTVSDGKVFVGASDGALYGFAQLVPGMIVAIQPAMTALESERSMEIVFNVTRAGLPIEGAFVSVTVSAGLLSQNGASTLADGLQRVKFRAPKVTENTTVTITAMATKYGMEEAYAHASFVVVPARDYGTQSGSGFSLDKYVGLLAAIVVLAAVDLTVILTLVLRRKRRLSA